ncbi:MAG: putative bifunctional diguanylate cyclase/phosphodiesterase, partial [Acidimicrobiales bacterium]
AEFRAALETSPIGMALTDSSGRYIQANEPFCRMLGYSREALQGLLYRDVTHPDDLPAQQEAIRHIHDGEADSFQIEKRYLRPDGSEVWALVSVAWSTDEEGRPVRVVQALDITDRREAALALERSEARLKALVGSVSDMITIHGPRGRLLYVNRSTRRVLGYTSDGSRVGMGMEDLVHADDLDGLNRAFTTWAENPGVGEPVEFRMRRADGTWRWFESVGTNRLDDPLVRGVIVVTRDTTERREAADALAYESLHDTLTGLPNRALFLDRLSRAMGQPGRRPGSIGVFFLDIDNFKVVNDSLGHDAGDNVLRAVARRIQDAMGHWATVARFGGDEFLVLCEELASIRQARDVARHLAEAVTCPVTLPDGEVRITASIGIALASSPLDEPQVLLRDADTALYRAKDLGRDRCEVFDEELRARMLLRQANEAALRQALERRELVVHYQPQVAMADQRIVGVEALVRWQHPERGLLEAGKFVPLAEEIGLIVPIGLWVLEEACRQLQLWQATVPGAERLWCSVNVSARQLTQPGFAEAVGAALASTGIPPDTLCLEVTETALMESGSMTLRLLVHLRELGVRLAIDDFGTGYASLSYLQRFPVDIIKIDRSFVDGLGRRPNDDAIVSALTGMGRALGLDVVAEGVETGEQAAHLQTLGCDLAQGFHFARPQPVAALTTLLGTLARPAEPASLAPVVPLARAAG